MSPHCAYSSCATTSATHWRSLAELCDSLKSSAVSRYVTRPLLFGGREVAHSTGREKERGGGESGNTCTCVKKKSKGGVSVTETPMSLAMPYQFSIAPAAKSGMAMRSSLGRAYLMPNTLS